MDFFTSSDRTQCVARVGPLVIGVTSFAPMTDASCVETAKEIIRAYHQVGTHKLVLQYSPRQSPNSKQRAIFAAPEMQIKDVKRTAVVTESAIVRGAVTALAWLQRSSHLTNAFSPKNVRSALDWLYDAEAFDRDEALAALNAMSEIVKIPTLG